MFMIKKISPIFKPNMSKLTLKQWPEKKSVEMICLLFFPQFVNGEFFPICCENLVILTSFSCLNQNLNLCF